MHVTREVVREVKERHHATLTGTGSRALVFVHGFGCDQRAWNLVAPSFSERFRVLTFDQVGCGRSDYSAYDPARHGTLHGYAEDLIELCAAFDLREAVLIGHSAGAMIGVLAANRMPGYFSELVMIGTTPRYLDDPETYYVGGFRQQDIAELLQMMDRNFVAFARMFAPVAMQNPERPELTERFAEQLCSGDVAIARSFARVLFTSDHRADVQKLQIPALILQCADDRIVPACVGEYLHAHMPQSTLRNMKATGHCPHLSHPAETTLLIEQYLSPSRPHHERS